jgi:hypothetical protein
VRNMYLRTLGQDKPAILQAPPGAASGGEK